MLSFLSPLLIGAAIVFLLAVIIGVRSKKKRAAYLALPVIYIGNKQTRTYHRTSCRTLSDSNKSNLVAFRHPQEPIKAGYKPCGTCKP